MQLVNLKGHILCCSHFQKDGQNSRKKATVYLEKEKKEGAPLKKPPVVIYSHGNAGCRLAALDEAVLCLNYGMDFVCFDFAGCGRSEGEKISLGFHEKCDLKTVVDYLLKEGYENIGLWGRSMGASTTLMFASEFHPPQVKCLVLDSPFTSIYDVALHLALTQVQIKIPKFLLSVFAKFGISRLRKIVLRDEKFDIYNVCPLKAAENCKYPITFFVGAVDSLVPPSHSAKMFVF